MNLLPKSHKEFTTQSYWEEFFKKRGTQSFEWYGEYIELCSWLNKYIRSTDTVLVVGCGNSKLSSEIYDHRTTKIVNIDISDIVIKQMREINKERGSMAFQKMDVTQMEFEDGAYSVVLDKGTLDALLPDDSTTHIATVEQMFAEISRVLKESGRYICITLAQKHITDTLLSYFTKAGGWFVRCHHITDIQPDPDDPDRFHWPVFMFVLTKFSSLTKDKQVLEMSHSLDKFERCETVAQLTSSLQQVQHYYMVQHELKTKSGDGAGERSIDLYSRDDTTHPRYTLYILHSKPAARDLKCALFIAPLGRECEWMFSSTEGRHHLADTAGFSRLIIACLSRFHSYAGMSEVQDELSEAVKPLAPINLPDNYKIPILTLGTDAVSCQRLLFEGVSDMSGKFVVEEVEKEDGDVFRALVFLDAPNLRQSEAKINTRQKKGKKKGKLLATGEIDFDFVASQYYNWVLAGFSVPSRKGSSMSVSVIGLGGGGLSMLITRNLTQVMSDVIELDPQIVEVARKYFHFKESERLTLFVMDGLQYIRDLCEKGEKRDVIVIDVDSKDAKLGISCPPLAFTLTPVLARFKEALHQDGVLILNLVGRSKERKREVMDRLKTVFPSVVARQVASDVNEVVYCLPTERGDVGDKIDQAMSSGNKTNVRALIEKINKLNVVG